ncbi:hypothetical protein Pcinc_031387, partial [Petrolisthes cinctipes]
EHPDYPADGGKDILIGLNDKFGDFTADGSYTPDSDLLAWWVIRWTGIITESYVSPAPGPLPWCQRLWLLPRRMLLLLCVNSMEDKVVGPLP